eukprot:jgi/Mesen1/9857/ME000070S09136
MAAETSAQGASAAGFQQASHNLQDVEHQSEMPTFASSSGAPPPLPLEDSELSGLEPSQSGDPGPAVIEHPEMFSGEILPAVSCPVVEVQPCETFHHRLEYISTLSHLAFFAICGVCIRYTLEIGFGPEHAHVTDDEQALMIDIPANMVGSFLMGWVGVVFKRDILRFSEALAVGLSTGLCGSITTYASLVQRMQAILTHGLWVRALAGYLIGFELAQMSLRIGIDTAEAFAAYLAREQQRREEGGKKALLARPRPDHVDRKWASLLLFLTLSGVLVALSAVGAVLDSDHQKRRRVWLACLLAPPGVWVRWYLAKLNGQGLGKKQLVKWFPVGTFLTNTIAGAVEAVVSAINIALATTSSELIVGGIQLGFLGCMSTVSTFAVETHTLHLTPGTRWRAYVYVLLTFFSSFLLGLVMYSAPVWIGNYDSRYNHV